MPYSDALLPQASFRKFFPLLFLPDHRMQLFHIFPGYDCFIVGVIMVGKFPVFFRIYKSYFQVLPFRHGNRADGIICGKHFFCNIWIPAVFFQNFPHKSIQICHLHIKVPVAEIGHCRIFSKDQHIMLIILSMTDSTFFKRLLPQCLIIRFIQHGNRLFSFFQKPFHTFKIIFFKRA